MHTLVPGSTLRAVREALDALGRQVAVESYREHRTPIAEDKRRAPEAAGEQAQAA